MKDSSSSVPSTETEYLANDKNPLLRNSSGLRLFFTPKANCSPSSLPLSLTNETNEMNVSGNGSTLGRGSTISDTPEVHTSPNEYMRNSEDEDTLRPRRPSLLDSIRSKMNGKSPSSGTMSQPLLWFCHVLLFCRLISVFFCVSCLYSLSRCCTLFCPCHDYNDLVYSITKQRIQKQ